MQSADPGVVPAFLFFSSLPPACAARACYNQKFNTHCLKTSYGNWWPVLSSGFARRARARNWKRRAWRRRGAKARRPITPGQDTLAAPFHLLFGQTEATVQYDGIAPETVGLYQFNVVVPNIASSDEVPLTFTLGGTAGTQTLYIAVEN